MLSFGQIQAWAMAQYAESSTSATLTSAEPLTTLITRWTNDVIYRISSFATWRFLEDRLTLSISAGSFYFPHHVHRVLTMYSSDRGFRDPLNIIGAWELDSTEPTESLSGQAGLLVLHGYYGCQADLPSDTVIYAASSAGAGDQNITVIVEGLDTSGDEQIETLTLGAAGTVTGTSTFEGAQGGVRRIHLGQSTLTTAPGIITVRATGATGTILERLDGSRELFHEHLRAELFPAPASATNFVVRYYHRPRPLRNANDVPYLPFEFEGVLLDGILAQLREYQGKLEESTAIWVRFKGRLDELLAWQHREPGRMRGFMPSKAYGFWTVRR